MSLFNHRLRILPVLFLLLIAASCPGSSRWNILRSGKIIDRSLRESSGLAASRQFRGVLWTHNDAGNPPELFAVDSRGRLLKKFMLTGAENNDWEDIALDDQKNLYILDNTSRKDPQFRSTIYFFPEPDPHTKMETVEKYQKFTIAFPDRGYDCETLFIHKGSVYLVTKPWDGTLPRIFRYAPIGSNGTAEFVGEVPVYAMITGGDISPDSRRVALISYTALLVFEKETDQENLFESEPLISRVNAGQVEAVAWDSNGKHLWISNEQSDIFRIREEEWREDEAPFLQTPRAVVRRLTSPPLVDQRLKDWPAGTWLPIQTYGVIHRIVRVVWSRAGIHIGIELPDDIELGLIQHPETFEEWFQPGLIYVMINPDGTRPLAYGQNDRTILLGLSKEGELFVEARYLRPATFIHSVELMPDWAKAERRDHRILLTIARETPGMEKVLADVQIGFNLIIVGRNGELLSWAPLTQRFSWDAPSIWGSLKLEK